MKNTPLITETIFQSKYLCKDTWLIQGDGCTSYLVVGDHFGLMIDSGYALENIREYAQTLTDKPVRWAANTHGHFDHTGGNGWFERAFMSAKALDIAIKPYPSKAALSYPLDYMMTVVGDGDTIELGNRKLEVFEIPAHAPSSLAFLDRKERLLFSGDEAAPNVMLYWMQEEPQPTIEKHAQNMKKLLEQRHAFDFICSGHATQLENASMVEDLLEHDQRIMSGECVGEQMMPLNDTSGNGPNPLDFRMYQIEFKRLSVYKNTAIGYDVRYILNK